MGYHVGCTTTTTLLPPFLGQRKGLTAPSMSVAPTARFGATVRVSRDTRINVQFRVVVTTLLLDGNERSRTVLVESGAQLPTDGDISFDSEGKI